MMPKDISEDCIQLLEEISSLTGINHDINNQLTIFSLSIRTIRKSASKFNDEKLMKIADQMEHALIEIEKTLTKIQPLKNNVLVRDFKEKSMGKK